MKLTPAELHRLCADAARGAGASAEHAEWLAAATVHAERRRHPAVGVVHLFDYLAGLRSGAVDGGAEPVVERNGAIVQVDAGEGIAQTAFHRALPLLREVLADQGTAVMAMRNSYTVGELGYYTSCLALEGVVALAVSNSPALVALGESGRPVVGTNPMSLAAPADDGLPLVIDQGVSYAAYVSVRDAAARGERIPEGWAVDENGRPTTDAKAALTGALLPIAGHKGANLGLLVEVLAGLAGGNWSVNAPSFEEGARSPGVGMFLIAIDPRRFGGDFTARLGAHLRTLGGEYGVYVPGRRSASSTGGDPLDIDDELVAALRSAVG
ncbi:Ldh family oxidoreductase [Brevibacterium daeguense]|nr:Ldh family oxidoreductase [Brevibacterium daeguense]